MNAITPVLIIGAGPVGLTTACELLRHGVPCRLIDASDGPTRWSKASVLHARTLEIFAAMGLIDQALQRGRRLHGLRVFHKGTSLTPLLHVTTDGLDTPYPFLLGLPQRDTEELLVAHLARLGGHVERQVRLQTLAQDEEGVSVGLSSMAGEEHTRARFVVACDGSYSLTRHLLRLPFDGHSADEVYLQGDVRMRWPAPFPADEIQAFFSDEGALVVMPTQEEGRYRLQAPLPSISDIEPSPATFRRLLAERGPTGAEIDELDWSVVFPVGKRLMRSFRVGRVLFAGDAAHQQSPASAQGMNLGIQDAHNLAWKLALCVRGLGQPLLLDSYDAERRAAAAACQEVAEQASRSFVPALTLRSALAQDVREALLRFLSHMTGFRERFTRSLAMLTTRYPESALLPEALGSLGGGPAPGEHAPDVELPGSGLPLSARIRPARHLLLLFSGDLESQPALPFLRRLALDVRSAYPDGVDTLLLLQRPVAEVGPHELSDPHGVVHQRYGARADAWVLLRPDQYVAYRAQPAEEQALFTYLEQVLGAPALARSVL